MSTIKNGIKTHLDIILYLFFGVCTTLVNIISYWIASHIIELTVLTSTILAWLLAVLFAYATNRKWVFHSSATNSIAIIRELSYFITCRVATGAVDMACMWIFVEKMCFNDIIIKLGANVLVIILNYIASKLIIFKARNQ